MTGNRRIQNHRTGWRVRRRGIAAAFVAVLVSLAVLRFFVFPSTSRADSGGELVVLLGPVYRGSAIDFTAHSWTGADTTILVSEGRFCPTQQFRRASRATIHCFRAEPATTQGEARFAAGYANRHHFRSIALVTTRDHMTRAELRFRRCWSGGLVPIAIPESTSRVISRVPYQAAALVKALTWERGC